MLVYFHIMLIARPSKEELQYEQAYAVVSQSNQLKSIVELMTYTLSSTPYMCPRT